MSFPGFVPVRQLVLVDLLSLILSVRPGERAVVAIDGIDEPSRRQVIAEVLALAKHVAGRDLSAASMDRFRRQGLTLAPTVGDGTAYYRSAFDYESFVAEELGPFRADPGDAVLLVNGVFLHRPELVGEWDASVFVRSGADAGSPMSAYLDQSPDLQATWVLDITTPNAPLLTYGATIEPTV